MSLEFVTLPMEFIKPQVVFLVALQCFILTSVSCNHYYLGFFKTYDENQVSIVLTTTELHTVSFYIKAPGVGEYYNGTLATKNVTIVNLNDNVIVTSHVEQNKGIYLTTDSDRVTVIGQILDYSTSDTFLALPLINFCVIEHIYYGISVDRTTHDFITLTSIVLIVGTENNTTMNLTVSQSVKISVGNITIALCPGREYSFIINRLQTIFIESLDDLTGTKVTTNNQVSVFSGHQSASIPASTDNPDHLIEQIPPTKVWGTTHYTVPLATRASYTIRVLAAYNSTNVTIYCNDTAENFAINEGEFIIKSLMLQEYCAIYSNRKVLLVQFSHGYGDNGDPANGDPMMTLVPATVQYLDRLDFPTSHSSKNYSHYVNIIVMAQYYQPSMIYLRSGGVNMSLESQEWVPIVVNNITEAYAARVNVQEGLIQLVHANSTGLLTAVAYGFFHRTGYGHPGGLKLTTATADGRDESSCQPLPKTTAGCSQEVDPYYGINWPSTLINMEATNNCPDGAGTAVRFCDSNGEWGIPVVSNCSSYEYRALLELMAEVNSSEDLNNLTSSLAVVSNKTDEGTSSYPSDLMNTNLLLEFSLDYIEQNPDSLDSNETVQNIVDCFSNILSPVNNAGWMELEAENPGQSQMILMNSERFGLLLAVNLDVGSVQVVVSDNIVISAELVAADNISNITFPEPNSGYNLNNSIFIPASYIQERAMTTGRVINIRADPIPTSNIIYENVQNILPVVNTQPVSPVLSSQVTATSNTSSEFAVQLTSQYSINSNDSEPVCGFWNFSLNNGSGGWDTAGVSVVSIDMSSSTIICNSTHLTSFAVLVDVSGGHQDIPEEESTALSIVSYIGCGISIICLVITIILLVCFRNTLLKGIHSFIHLNLAIALLLALILFVSGIETATKSEAGCTVVAALLHYFFTAVFTWMLCEGIMLYFLLVKVFNTGLGQRKLFYLAIGWGVPVPIVAISAGIAHDQYGHDDFCWMDIEKGAIWGFVAPMLAIIIVNIVFLIMALHSLYKNKRAKMTAEETSRASLVKTILKATVILLPLLGITWVLGILSVNQESSVFAWIFTIFNSLQGMFILFFHVIRNEKIWEKIACWKDDKYSSSPSSQQSSATSRGAKIKKGFQTASTDPSGYNMELKSKPDISHFEEFSGIDNKSKVEPSAVETENENPPITDEEIRQEKEAVTTFSV